MKRTTVLVLAAALACGCGAERPGRLGFLGDRVLRAGWEFWRSPDGRTVYFHEKAPRQLSSGGPRFAGSSGFECSETLKVTGRDVWHWPVWQRRSGEPWFTRPERHRYASQERVWERFGATADEAKLQLADTRPSARPGWVRQYDACAANKGRR